MITPRVRLKLAGVWTDVSTHVLLQNGMKWRRGIFEAGPTACLAQPGSFAFDLDNDPDDGALGYYTPGNAACRAGFMQGILCDLRLTDGTNTRYKWRGRIRTIAPEPGIYGGKRTTCVAEDWMANLAKQDASNLDLLEGVFVEDAVAAIVALCDEAPVNVDYDGGVNEFAFVFDDLGGGDGIKAMTAAQRVVQSEGGYLYLRGDATDGETLRLENQSARTVRASDATYDDTAIQFAPDALVVPSTLERVVNTVDVVTYRRRVDPAVSPATTVLLKLDAPIAVQDGVPVRIFVDYRDPAQEAVFIGRKSMEPLTVVTDYTVNDAEDGGGADVSADVTVVGTFFGSRAMIEIENSSGGVAYVRGPGTEDGLQGRGIGLYRYGPVTSRGENAASIALYGVLAQDPIDLIYQGSPNVGQDRADLVVTLYGGLTNVPQRVRVLTEREELEADAILRDIGDKITIQETITVPDETDVFIQGIEQEYTVDGVVLTWFTLAPADTSAALIFDDPDFGKFDERVFAYG